MISKSRMHYVDQSTFTAEIDVSGNNEIFCGRTRSIPLQWAPSN